MLRYQAAALALKAFSVTPATRTLYRQIANWRGNQRATGVHHGYTDAASWLRDTLRANGVAGPNLHLAELGTGWMHFYGIAAALMTGAEVDLYDVWDNRQFNRMKAAFGDPDGLIQTLGLEDPAARQLVHGISAADSPEDVYEALGLRYVVDPGGELGPLPDATYDAVFSVDVLEHVYANSLRAAVAGQFRVLKPGGLALHQVGADDHLTHYDRAASLKQYLAYGEAEWRLRFDNVVQYVNRTSLDDFRKIYVEAGFEEVEASAERRPDTLAGLRIAPQFQGQSQEALEAVRLFLVYRKPLKN